MHVAARRGDIQVIEYLVSKGADKAPRLQCPNRSPWGNSSQKFDSVRIVWEAFPVLRSLF
jgi:hypothetical protein